MAEGLTKKQFKELRKLEKMQSHSMEQKSNNVKWIAISIVSAIFLLLFVGIIVVAKTKNNVKATGAIQFANNGHERMLTSKGTDATISANPSVKSLTLVEYGDIQCPACKAYHPIVKQLLAAYPDQLKLVFKNFPLTSVHPNAMNAAIAAEAVGRQGKYFQFVDMLYDKQDEWAGLDNPQSKFEEYVKSMGLDVAQFKKDQGNSDVTKLVNDERNEGIQNGVSGTPTFFLDGKKLENPASIDDFKKIVNQELKDTTGNNPPAAQPTTPSGSLPLQP